MKKLVYLIIMSLLLTLVPVDSAQAATKVSGPTVTAVYNKKLDDFKYKFTHPNKNAVIYYRGVDTKKWKRAKNGQTLKLGYFEQQDGIYVYAKVGRTKSKARLVYPRELDEKRVDYLIKQEMNKLIDKDDTKDMKFIKLLGYFKNNYDYIWLDDSERDLWGNLTYYRKGGMCSELAEIFVRYCRAIGIKAEYISSLYSDIDYTYVDNHAWTHVYIDEYPILVDPTSIVCCGNLNKGVSLWDNESYKNSKYKFTKASKCGHGIEYVENNKICYSNPPFDVSIPDDDNVVKLEKNKVIIRYRAMDTNYEETYEYYPNTGYWYCRWVNIDTGEVLEDDKAEVDAWYAAHPEVERKYGKYAVRE